LKMVLRQLDLIQDHFKRLNDNDLAEEELEITLKKSIEEVYKEFADDVPPLDTELIYSSLIKAVRESRALMAADWIKHNLPDSADLKQVSLQELMEIKQRLANKPRFLSIEQTHKVKEIIKICDKQLDEHEIEGLLVRIKNMNRDKRRIFIQRLLKMIKEEDLLKIKILITTKSWWDSVDSLTRVVGNLALSYPTLNETLLEWSLDENMWLRRMAIIHQLLRKKKTDTLLLEKIIVNNLNNTQFFINKAIGWALRDYSKTNAQWVRNFIDKYKKGLSSLSIREGSKYI